MKYLDRAHANVQASDPDIADAAIAFIEANDAVETARLALDRANDLLLDRQRDFLSLIGQ
jgi:hypothetical protein